MQIKKLTIVAIFLALAIVATYFSFPILPSATYLTIDFSDIFLISIAVLLNARYMVLSIVLKGVFLYIKHPELIGVCANLCNALIFVGTFYSVYKRTTAKQQMVGTLVVSTVVTTLVMCVANFYVFLPAYGMKSGLDLLVLTTTLPFNVLKGSIVSAVALFLLKQPIFKKINVLYNIKK